MIPKQVKALSGHAADPANPRTKRAYENGYACLKKLYTEAVSYRQPDQTNTCSPTTSGFVKPEASAVPSWTAEAAGNWKGNLEDGKTQPMSDSDKDLFRVPQGVWICDLNESAVN